jgi:crotonobetainyl-CoA:carnitine CoA-transferase CaiB-like acyl-CoA transferase
MGADVIKVESCTNFDWWRGWEATPEWIAENNAEKAPAFNMVNRNKRAIAIDLHTDTGADLLKHLVTISDIVVENFSAGVLPQLGLDYPVLKSVNPELVMLSMPAFGSSGPWQYYRAYGSTIEQASGLPHLNGHPDWLPTMIHVALGDSVAGLNGAAALLTALRHRKRTGEGQYLDLSQSECLFPLGVHGIVEQSGNGRAPLRLGNKHAAHAPHGVYPCAGDDQWIVIQVFDEQHWSALRALTGKRLEDFGAQSNRKAREAELDDTLGAWTSSFDAGELETRLMAAGVPAAQVRSALDAKAHPQLMARKYFQMMDRAHVGTIANPSAPYRESRDNGDPYPLQTSAPTLGEHNEEVLGQLLGLTPEAIARLAEQNIIGTLPRMH